jgi:hypothetical protein
LNPRSPVHSQYLGFAHSSNWYSLTRSECQLFFSGHHLLVPTS